LHYQKSETHRASFRERTKLEDEAKKAKEDEKEAKRQAERLSYALRRREEELAIATSEKEMAEIEKLEDENNEETIKYVMSRTNSDRSIDVDAAEPRRGRVDSFGQPHNFTPFVTRSKSQYQQAPSEHAALDLKMKQLEQQKHHQIELRKAEKDALEAKILAAELKLRIETSEMEQSVKERLSEVHRGEIEDFAKARRQSTVHALESQKLEHEMFPPKASSGSVC